MRRCQALPCRPAAASLIMEVQQDASTFAVAPPHPSPKRKACWFCTSDNKISTRCQKYDAHICKTHSIITWHSSKWKQTGFFFCFWFYEVARMHTHAHTFCLLYFFFFKEVENSLGEVLKWMLCFANHICLFPLIYKYNCIGQFWPRDILLMCDIYQSVVI